jgi:hypothetical protein
MRWNEEEEGGRLFVVFCLSAPSLPLTKKKFITTDMKWWSGEILVGPVETEFQGRLGFSEDNRPAHYNFLYC